EGTAALGAPGAEGTEPGTCGTSYPCMTPVSMTPPSGLCDSHARPAVDAKNAIAAHLVVRDRKFAAPAAPNRLPADPLPNEEPMSASLPCCVSTNTITLSVDMSFIAIRLGFNHSIKNTPLPQAAALLKNSEAISAAPPTGEPS